MPNPHISTQGMWFAGFFSAFTIVNGCEIFVSAAMLIACCKQTCEFLLVFTEKKKVNAFLRNVDVYFPPK